MPLYEYRCDACKRLVTVLTRSFSPPEGVACDRCGGTKVHRLLSKVTVLRSEESRLDALADSAGEAGLDESDPRQVASWVRKMGHEFRDDLGPEFDEMVDKMEAGEAPDEGEAGGLGESNLGEDDT